MERNFSGLFVITYIHIYIHILTTVMASTCLNKTFKNLKRE